MGRIAILGSNGSMGRRYQAILNSIGKDYYPLDQYDWQNVKDINNLQGVIICSPTEEHIVNLRYLKEKKIDVPILCEKPVTKSKQEMNEILSMNQSIQMVNQYKHLANPVSRGKTFYNYYNSGKDGILWDCLNIFGLAKDACEVRKTSPIWTCEINGDKIHIEDMDGAYVDMIKLWLVEPRRNTAYFVKAHNRIWNLYEKNRYSDTGSH